MLGRNTLKSSDETTSNGNMNILPSETADDEIVPIFNENEILLQPKKNE